MSTETMVYAYTKSEDRKLPLARAKLPPLFDEKVTFSNWYRFVHWRRSSLFVLSPLVALYGMATTDLQTKTLVWAVVYYFMTGIGITAGYHRLFAHRAYGASWPLKLYLTCAGSGTVEGSIAWWTRDHRAHHRWTDTDKDPYSAHRGFFFSHIGWTLIDRPKSRLGYADMTDLNADPLVRFQDKYYYLFALFFGVVLSTLVAGLGWNDYRGGFFYATIARMCFMHHSTFCVNSLAHIMGETPFDDHHTPRDHWITAMVTFGEGYHNFHHEFPQDYRNAIKWYQYDPSKWLIKTCFYLGLAYDLKTFPSNEVNKGMVQMKEKKLLAERRQLAFGTPLEDLPIYTWQEYQHLVLRDNKKWILIEGILYDVCDFMHDHPGGSKYLSTALGKDMTTGFNGALYNHSNAARNLLTNFRCGVLKNGMQIMTDDPIPQGPLDSKNV